MEAKKIRGSDNEPNFILVENIFHSISPDLVSFEMVFAPESIENIYCIGYSKHHKMIFIQFRNNKRLLYSKIPIEKWYARHNYSKINIFYSKEIKGFSFYETNDHVRLVANQYVMDAYQKLEYFKNTAVGLWATDCPDKIVDPENILFEIK